MKQKHYLFTLLMAIALMAISTTKMWATSPAYTAVTVTTNGVTCIYDNFESAFEAAEDGSIITLYQDMTVDRECPQIQMGSSNDYGYAKSFPNGLIIDLNGCTLTLTKGLYQAGISILVNEGNSLTIKNGQIIADGNIAISTTLSPLTLENVTIKGDNLYFSENSIWSSLFEGSPYYIVDATATTVTLDGCTIQSQNFWSFRNYAIGIGNNESQTTLICKGNNTIDGNIRMNNAVLNVESTAKFTNCTWYTYNYIDLTVDEVGTISGDGTALATLPSGYHWQSLGDGLYTIQEGYGSSSLSSTFNDEMNLGSRTRKYLENHNIIIMRQGKKHTINGQAQPATHNYQ